MQLSFFTPQFADFFSSGTWDGDDQYFFVGSMENAHDDLSQLKNRFLFVIPRTIQANEIGDGLFLLTYVLYNPESQVTFFYQFEVKAHSWLPSQSIIFPVWMAIEIRIQKKFPFSFKGIKNEVLGEHALSALPQGAGIYAARGLEWKELTKEKQVGQSIQAHALCAGNNVWRLAIGVIPKEANIQDFSFTWGLSFIENLEKRLNIQVSQYCMLWRTLISELERIEIFLQFLLSIDIPWGKENLSSLIAEKSSQMQELLRMYFGNQKRGEFLVFGEMLRYPDRSWEGLALKLIREIYLGLEKVLANFDKNLRYNKQFASDLRIRGESGLQWGVTGPNLRSMGIRIDHREKRKIYKRLEHRVALGINGEIFDRIWVRAWEIKESAAHCGKILDWVSIPHACQNNPNSIDLLDKIPAFGSISIEDIEGTTSVQFERIKNQFSLYSFRPPMLFTLHALMEWAQGYPFENLSLWLKSFNIQGQSMLTSESKTTLTVKEINH